VSEGMLEIHKGIGTFITSKTGENKTFFINTSFTNKTLAAGKRPSTIVLDFYQTEARDINPSIIQKTGMDLNEKIVVCKRLRLADDKPVILECHYFRQKLYPPIKKEYVEISVYDMFTKRFKIKLVRMDENIRTTIISGKTKDLLGLQEDQPGLLFNFMPYNENDVPLYFAEVIYRGDSFEFHNRIGPIQMTHVDTGSVSFPD
jgi:GntR family transcriptional regulator